ncbi:hypothetical protein, partial [Corynebacterium sanguinis]|uniref:hypothetical protein n=1 Tax=Corynebacterium sanguinis TaxID=2594913 RepID=UPI00223AA406
MTSPPIHTIVAADKAESSMSSGFGGFPGSVLILYCSHLEGMICIGPMGMSSSVLPSVSPPSVSADRHRVLRV